MRHISCEECTEKVSGGFDPVVNQVLNHSCKKTVGQMQNSSMRKYNKQVSVKSFIFHKYKTNVITRKIE